MSPAEVEQLATAGNPDEGIAAALFLAVVCVVLATVTFRVLLRQVAQIREVHRSARAVAADRTAVVGPAKQLRIDDLEKAFWAARRRGDVAQADQIEAELRDLRAPLWC